MRPSSSAGFGSQPSASDTPAIPLPLAPVRALSLLLALAVSAALLASAARAQITGTAPNLTLASGTETQGGTYKITSSTLTQSGGTLNVGTFILEGDSTYNISAGTGSFTDLQLGFMVASNLSTAYVNQSGGNLTVASNLQVGARNAIGSGSSINAYYNLSGGSLTANSVTLYQVNGFSTTAHFGLHGGTLTTSSILKGTGSGSFLNFNGGTLRAGPSDNFNWINSGITARVATGGAIFDTNGRTMGNYAYLLHDPDLGATVDGGLTKKGAGTLTLFYNNNTYTGATTLQEGTLSIGTAAALGAATNALNFSGGTLQIKRQDGQAAGTDPVDFGSHVLNTTTFDGGLDIADADHTFTLSQSLSGTGALAKLGDGTLVLSAAGTRSGATTVSAGTLRLTDSLALQASPVTVSGTGVLDFGTLTAVTFGALHSSAVALQNTSAAPLALTLGGGNTTATAATAFTGAGSLAKTGTGTITLSGANTYTGGTAISAGTLQFANTSALPATGALTVASGATAAFNVGGTGEFTLSGIGSILGSSTFQSGSRLGLDTTNAAGGTFAFSDALGGSLGLTKLGTGNLTLTGANTYSGGTLVSAGALTGNSTSLQGNITNNAAVNFDQNSDGTYAGNMSGTGSLTKSYAGNLTLTGTNTYSGGTTINAGTLTGNSASLQGNIANSAALVFDQASTGTYVGVVSGSGSLTKSGAGNLTLSGANTYSGGTTVSAGTLTGDTTSLQGNIADNAALVFNQTSTGTYAGIVSGSGSLAKSGAGNLTLSGANTYSGGTTVSAGTLTGATTSLQGNIANNAALVFDQSSAGTYAGVISGSGSLTKSNSGTLTLTGANTFTGGTTISAGTLQIGSGGTSGSLTGNIADNAALVFNRSDASTYSGVISGTGTLTKLGAGTLTLSGASTYTGATALNAGLVEFSASNNFGSGGSITIEGGGLRWAAGNTFDISGRLTAFGASGATFDTNGNNVTFATALTSSGGTFTKSGAGTLTLSAANTYTGGTTVNAGTLTLNGAAGTGTGLIRGALTINSGATVNAASSNALGYDGSVKIDTITLNGGTLDITSTADQGWGVAYILNGNGSTLTSNGGVSSSSTGSKFAFGNNSSLTVANDATATIAGRLDLRSDVNSNSNFTVGTGGNLAISAAITSSNGASPGVAGFTKLGAGTMTLTAANTYSGATAIDAGTLQAGNASALGSGGAISFGGGTLQYGSGITTDFSSRFSTAASQSYSIDTNGNAVTFATALTSSGGALTKSGSGTLTLTGINTYTRGTTVNAGTLTLNGAAGTGTGLIRGALTINSGAIVNAASSNALGYDGSVKIDTVTLNGGTLDITSTADQGWGVAYILNGNGSTLTSNGGVSSSSTGSKFAFGNNSSLTVANDATATIAGRLDLRSDVNSNSNFTVGAGGNLAISAAITSSNGASPGVAGFTKLGAGTMTLTAANTYSGATAVDAGTLVASANNALGTAAAGTTVASEATLALSGGFNYTTGETVTLSGTGASGRNGALDNLSGNNAFAGPLVLAANVQVGAASGTTLTLSGGFTETGGARTLTFAGAGTTVLTGTAAHTGGTTVASGIVTVDTGGSLSAATAPLSLSGGTLNLNVSQTVSQLSGTAGTLNLGSSRTLTVNQTTDTSFTGSLAGAGGLTKSGVGTLTLQNVAFSGPLLLNAGRLNISGTVGALAINSGATLSPGNSPGTLSSGDTTFASGGSLVWEINRATNGTAGANPGWDLLSISGALTITATSSSSFTINLTSLTALNAAGTPANFDPATNYTFNFVTATGGINGFDTSAFTLDTSALSSAFTGTWSISSSTNALSLNYTASAIPEPGTYATLAGLATLALALTRRTRRRLK